MSAGFSPLIRHEARLWQTVLSMVEFGMGVALVPRALQRVHTDRLSFLPLVGDTLESQTVRLRRANDAPPAAAARFADYLDKALKETLP